MTSRRSDQSPDIKFDFIDNLRLTYKTNAFTAESFCIGISIILAQHIHRNQMTIFKRLTGDKEYSIRLARGACDYVFLYYLCCCCVADNEHNNFIQNYNISKSDVNSLLYADEDLCVKEHWRYLKFWKPSNLLKILKCENKQDPFDMFIRTNICFNLDRIKSETFSLLRY